MYDSLIKTILLETFFSAVLARNIVMLRKSLRLRRDVKAGNTEKVKARITFTRTAGTRSYMARAVYTVGGSKITGSTVCAVGFGELRRGDEKYVIIGKTDSSVFALDEQQTKDAVLTWTVLTALMAIVVIFFAAGIVFEIIK